MKKGFPRNFEKEFRKIETGVNGKLWELILMITVY